MPLVSVLGEQYLNTRIAEDQPGNGVWLIKDSNLNLFGLIEEYRSAEFRVSAFFVQNDIGLVTTRYELGEGTAFNFAIYDQDAFLIYPANGDFDTYPAIVFYSETPPYLFEGDVAEYPPNYVFESGQFRQVDGGTPVPIGRGTEASFANGTARVYQGPDGDGTGIFLEVIDGEGNRIGGITRVNDDTTGDQFAPIVGGLDEAFTVAWTQEAYDGANTETYLAKTFNLTSNLGSAIARDADGTYRGDKGDYFTDIFLFDTAAASGFNRDRIVNFGANDILVTTTKIYDSNGDGIIGFGSNKRLDLANDNGDAVASLTISGVKSLEYDGQVEGQDGQTYYIYSRVGSEADEHYLIA